MTGSWMLAPGWSFMGRANCPMENSLPCTESEVSFRVRLPEFFRLMLKDFEFPTGILPKP